MWRRLIVSMVFSLCVFCVPSVGDAVTLEFVSVNPVWTNVLGTTDFNAATSVAAPDAKLAELRWIFADPNYLTNTSVFLFEGGIPGSVFDVGVESNLAPYSYASLPHAMGDSTVTSADLEIFATVSDGVNTTVGDVLVATLHLTIDDVPLGTDTIEIAGVTSSFSVGGVQYEMVDPKWMGPGAGTISSDTVLITETFSGTLDSASANIHATIVAVVPEPGMYALLGSCLAVAGFARRLGLRSTRSL